jgi:long-chain acyl-CoA synthetase
VPPRPDDVVFQVYTSGTTGQPKGAMLTHANMLALRAPGYRAGLEWFPTPYSTLGAVLPVAHIAGTAYACFGFYAGARVVIAREFDPGETLELIESEEINHILFAPAVMRMVMEHARARSTDFASLKFITYGAAPIPESLLRDALAMFGCGFVQMYGMSEAAGGVVALTPEDHVSGVQDRLRSAGRAMPGVEVGIVGQGWTLLPPGETGEIVIRSGSVMTGYWNRPEANAEVLGPDGWFRTGDIGTMDDAGYVYVLDRAKDMIISGGENVYPAEVENAIFGHPDVVDVAVIGIPSDEWGEEVTAIIVPAPGAEVTREAISHWLEGKIARFKFPKHVHLIKEIPRNAGEKILRRTLREPYWQHRRRRIN